MKRSGFKRRTYQRSPVTPLSALGAQEPRRVVTECKMGPMQEKEPPREDPKRIAWLKQTVTWCQVCGARGAPLDVSHINVPGDGSMGRKPPDRQTIRACTCCHRDQWHGQGHYAGKTREESNALNEALIRENNLAYAGEQ